MPPIVIRIEPEPAVQDGFRVALAEADGAETSATLTRQRLTDGRWTANLNDAPPPENGLTDGDIVRRVIGADKANRDHQDLVQIARTLYDWLLPEGPLRNRWNELNAAGDPR